MTNNEHLKEDATELLGKLMNFKRKYSNVLSSKRGNTCADEFERELRIILFVARTDEENNFQINNDLNC